MSNTLNFCFYVFYCNLEEKDHTRRIIKSKKKKYKRNQYYCFLIYRKSLSSGPVQQKIKLPSPNYTKFHYSIFNDAIDIKIFLIFGLFYSDL